MGFYVSMFLGLMLFEMVSFCLMLFYFSNHLSFSKCNPECCAFAYF